METYAADASASSSDRRANPCFRQDGKSHHRTSHGTESKQQLDSCFVRTRSRSEHADCDEPLALSVPGVDSKCGLETERCNAASANGGRRGWDARGRLRPECALCFRT